MSGQDAVASGCRCYFDSKLGGFFPKVGVPFEAPIIRATIFWGSILGSPFLGEPPYQQ